MGTLITADDLAIELPKGGEVALFKWFLASFLMGKRIQATVSAETYRVIVEKHGIDSPEKLVRLSHRHLVSMLGEGGYARYDESTATRLSALGKKLIDDYSGKIGTIRQRSENRQAFEKRLQEFDGVGPKTVEIFMREAAQVLF